MIKEEEPPKPSTRLSDSGEELASISAQRHMEPAKLTKLVRGELDWIVMKSLEKDAADNPPTAPPLKTRCFQSGNVRLPAPMVTWPSSWPTWARTQTRLTAFGRLRTAACANHRPFQEAARLAQGLKQHLDAAT